MIALPNPCPQCHKHYTNPTYVKDEGWFLCPNCRYTLGADDAKDTPSVDFWQALQLVNMGYRMRYQDWPDGDYLARRLNRPVYRFINDVEHKPYDVLPWITSNMMQGKWYFAKRKETE